MEAITTTLYVLELEGGKFYVGQSDQVGFRFQSHLNAKGAKWTQLYPAKKLIREKVITCESIPEIKLYENWLTLLYMEKMGWHNVRGGDFLKVENYLIKQEIEHIFDCEQNKLLQYLPNCKYLYGVSQDPIIYILELAGGKYYIGSTQRLGRSLGKHFQGKGIAWTRLHPPIKVLDYYTVPAPSSAVEERLKRLTEHVAFYGKENVLGGNFQRRS